MWFKFSFLLISITCLLQPRDQFAPLINFLIRPRVSIGESAEDIDDADRLVAFDDVSPLLFNVCMPSLKVLGTRRSCSIVNMCRFDSVALLYIYIYIYIYLLFLEIGFEFSQGSILCLAYAPSSSH